MKTNKKVILITGASSGMGMHTAIRLAEEGNIVYAAARRTELMNPLKQKGIRTLYMDITVTDSVEQAVKTIVTEQNRIDILINNAGYGSFGAIEDVDLQEAHHQFDVNVFGLALITQKILPVMRKQRSGTVINIGSVAGRMPFNFGTWYNATKYSVRAITESMRMELRPYGIKTILIEPGPIATAWGAIAADHLEQSSLNGAYEQQAANAAAGLRRLYAAKWLTKPEQVADKMVRITHKRHPHRRYPVGRGARMMLILHALLPASIYERIATNLMARL